MAIEEKSFCKDCIDTVDDMLLYSSIVTQFWGALKNG